MAVNFPTNPNIGDEVTAGSATLKWDGTAWVSSGSSSGGQSASSPFSIGPSNQRTGTGQVLQFDNANYQSIVVGPSTSSTQPTAQRLVVAGRDGETGTTGEGGDVYLWAGRGGDAGGSGGDIKVDAGNGGGTTGYGGTIKIRGGYSQDGTGGFVNIDAGSSSMGSGGNISIAAGTNYSVSEAVGGSVSIYGGGSADETAGGSVVLATYQNGKIVLSGDGGEFLNDPNNPSNQIATLGDIASGSTGDIAFSGVRIIGAGTAAGDGSGNGTMELAPDADLATDQYLIVDPTAPNHIHIRAGGEQDNSSAHLIIGGEKNNVEVSDVYRNVKIHSRPAQVVNSYTNLNEESSSVFITTTDAQITYDYSVNIDGTTYIVTGVDVAQGQLAITAAGATFQPGAYYTFTYEEPWTNDWTFDNNGTLYGPVMGGLKVMSLWSSSGEDLYVYGARKIVLDGTEGEFIGDTSNPLNQIATLGDVTQGPTGPQGEPGAGFGIFYLGNYNSEAGYVTDLAVVRGSDGQLYLAKSSGQLGNPVDYQSNAQWEVWIPKGADGANGTGLRFMGEWDDIRTFVPNDIVTFNGECYISIVGSTVVYPPDTMYWTKIAAKGTDGLQGATGPQGEQGPTGPAGADAPGSGDSGWIEVTSLSNSFVVGNTTPAYRKLNGVVYLRGNAFMGSATADSTAFVLPAGFRPSYETVITTQKFGTGVLTYVTVTADGAVKPHENGTWFSGIIFPAA